MDKKLVGQWYNEELGGTLNIFDEMPLRMKMSFSSSGYYNFEPNCVYEKDGYLCFEINDETYRMVYHVKAVEDRLEGYYTQFGKETPVQYLRVSETPKDEDFRYAPTEIYVPESGKSRIEILKEYADYDRNHPDKPYTTEYHLGGEIPEILQRYDFLTYVKDLDMKTDAIAFRMLDFVCDHFGHDGRRAAKGKKIEDIVAFCEKNNCRVNCRGLAVLLASLLRLVHVRARHITCMPYEDPFQDCHVVVDCELPSGKRVMFDPTWRLYLKDAQGEFVSLERLRRMLITGEAYFANADASYNGECFDKDSQDYQRNYMIKNTFRFARGTLFADGTDEREARRVELIPKGYPTDTFRQGAKEEFVYNDIEFWRM